MEEERLQAAKDEISIPSVHNSDSESSDTSYEPESSSSKESTLPAKHTDDNEETPLKITSLTMDIQKEVLDTIKKLYFMCGGEDSIEHLYILPSQWKDLLKYESISDEIYENLKMPAVR